MSRYGYCRPPFSGAFLGGKSIHDIQFFLVILIGLDLLFHVVDFGNLFIFAGSHLKMVINYFPQKQHIDLYDKSTKELTDNH